LLLEILRKVAVAQSAISQGSHKANVVIIHAHKVTVEAHTRMFDHIRVVVYAQVGAVGLLLLSGSTAVATADASKS